MRKLGWVIVLLLALASYILPKVFAHDRVVHEKRRIASSEKRDRISDDAIIPIRIAIKQSSLQHGYDLVMDVSDPQSANYGISIPRIVIFRKIVDTD